MKVARALTRLAAYEWLFAAYGVAALVAVGLLSRGESLPPAAPFGVLCFLSALAVRFEVPADTGEKISSSAQAVVVAAAALAFREASPHLGPLLVGMSGAMWRIPRTRHQFFTLPGNFGAYGLPALASAAVVSALATDAAMTALTLALVAIPASLAYAATNSALVAIGIAVAERESVRAAARELAPHLTAAYVPFTFGAFVGELSLRFGAVVFPMAAVSFVMVQVVFASYRKLRESERAALDGLVAAVEAKDPYTAGHSKRVMKFASYMGRHLGYRGRDLERLEQHALMHDIGKLAVPNHVLRKPGKLDPDEREIMLRHEEAGAAILAGVPFLALSADIAQGLGHTEGFDGVARPAHIVHAADAFDAMTSTRAYRRAHSQDDAFVEMRAKIGKDFHRDCVNALAAELEARGETYGAGGDEDEVLYDVAPPEAPLGSTLDDEAAADAAKGIAPPRPKRKRRIAKPIDEISKEARALVGIGKAAAVAALFAATTTMRPLMVPIALGAAVAAGEMLTLRPLRRIPRPLSYIPMLVALYAVPLRTAIAAIGLALFFAALVREEPRGDLYRAPWLVQRAVPAAAMIGAFAGLHAQFGRDTIPAALYTLGGAAVAALLVQELIDGRGRVALDWRPRLADLAIVAGAPLVALGTRGTTNHAGLGLGAFAVLVVPIGLLAYGYARTQRAHENLFAWMRAASLAPEYAGLVVPGRAERVARYARELAARAGLDPETTDQLEAAAWMERVGECCLDESYVSGEPHRADEIVDASATILKSSEVFYPAGQILWATLNEPEMATGSAIDRAGQILRVAIAFEDATNGDIAVSRVPKLMAVLRTSSHHQLDTELCDMLQQVVAPGTNRSPWEPVRTHALLTCGCVARVDEWAFAGDDVACAEHGERFVDELVLERARSMLHDPAALELAMTELVAGAGPVAVPMQRELVSRLAASVDDVEQITPVVRAGYHTGRLWEGHVATWLHETGASARDAFALLVAAGTRGYEIDQALTYAGYSPDELNAIAN